MNLSHDWPRMEPSARARLEQLLAEPCPGESWPPEQPDHLTATLRRRLTRAAVVVVCLQCDTCGRSLGGPLPRKPHWNWQSYPEWDAALVEAQEAKWQEQVRSNERERFEERARRSSDYLHWCRRSPEWHAVSSLVMQRAGGRCEACLSAPAVTVHHLTYSRGKLPPAWDLRAVCRECHARLHDPADEWISA